MNNLRQHWLMYLIIVLLVAATVFLVILNWDNAKGWFSGGGTDPSWTPPTRTSSTAEFSVRGGDATPTPPVSSQETPTVQPPQTPPAQQSPPQEELWRFWTVNWECSKITCNTICSPDLVVFNNDFGRYEVVQLPDYCGTTMRVNGGGTQTPLMNSVATEDEFQWEIGISCPSQDGPLFKGTLYPPSYLDHPRWLKIVYEGDSSLRTAPVVSDYTFYIVARQGDLFQLLGKVEGESIRGNSEWYVVYDQSYKMVLYVHSSLAW